MLRLADADPATAKALVKLLSEAARRQGMLEHSYIVGGAPRDVALGYDFKDVDVVVEPVNGKNAVTLSKEVAKMLGGLNTHPDQYGVVHIGPVPGDLIYEGVNLKGQKIEIVTARKEKYDRAREKGSYKPSEVEPGTILEDLLRRDFTFNTLIWRLLDVANGPDKAAILDLTGMGFADLKAKIVRTPLDPSETFKDDPSRMLRAIRFAIKYGFDLDPKTRRAIKQNAAQIRRMPYSAYDTMLFDKILPLPDAKKALTLMKGLGLLDHIIDEIPPNRFRKALRERAPNIDMLLTLAGFDIPTGLEKLDKRHLRMLRRIEEKLDRDDLGEVYNKLLKPPIDNRQLMAEGITGSALGEARNLARDIILSDPFIKPAKLQKLLMDKLLSGTKSAMTYSYDRRASTSPELRDLAKKMTAILKGAGYDKVQVKASGRTVTVNLTGQGRADWMVMDTEPVVDPGPGGRSLSGYIYFGPIPVQQTKAFVWEEASVPLDRRRTALYRRILEVMKDKLREAS